MSLSGYMQMHEERLNVKTCNIQRSAVERESYRVEETPRSTAHAYPVLEQFIEISERGIRRFSSHHSRCQRLYTMSLG